MNRPDRIEAPVVVVGGGIAGLSAALALEGCTLVADGLLGEGSSQLAQGGIAAAIGAGDSPAQHAADTVQVGAGLTDAAIAELVTDAAPGRVDWLERLGAGFDRDDGGALRLGREAGHGHSRIVHAGGDRTGASVMRALRAAVLRRPDIRVLEGFELVDLVVSDDRAAGVLLERPDGSGLVVIAPQVVLATGGIGACFEHSTNPSTSRGTGLAAAARAGATLSDLEFVQFHPTALAVGGARLPLLTEALRGAGAVLLDDMGRRFMPEIHADAELAPRDIVARAVAARSLAGQEVLLDLSPVADVERRFPGSAAIARAAGLDPRGALPVTAAAHFHMGGIATDACGATSLRGLYACGEVAATGLHGGNRLASNSLLEGLVFGERIARAIRAAPLAPPGDELEVPHRRHFERAGPSRIAATRRLMSECLGPVRRGEAMAAALVALAATPPTSRAEEDLATIARLVLASALARRESRGAHCRAEFPERDEAQAVRRFIAPAAVAVRPLFGLVVPPPGAIAPFAGAASHAP